VNAFVIDREGNRINRRNAEDIFVPLYNHQIPPGAADAVHYRLSIPPDLRESVTVNARLLYRKFDTEFMALVTEDESYANDLPVLILAEDRVTFPVHDATRAIPEQSSAIDVWQRWNDYGIGLLRKGRRGELRQAAEAFSQVEEAGRPDGPLNLVRVYLKEGLVQTHAQEALSRAAEFVPPANSWSLLWFGAQVAQANGDYDRAIFNLREILRGGFAQADGRGFDFSKDYRVLNALGSALYQRGFAERGAGRREFILRARDRFTEALSYDPENLTAHWGLKQVYRALGEPEKENEHAEFHSRYKPDDNAADFAVARARVKYPAANKAAEAVVIYDLHRGAGEPEVMDEYSD
jgi:hypothetical protein